MGEQEGGFPILATGLLEEGGEVAPVHLPWKIEIRRFEEGRDKVGTADGFGANFAGGKFLGHAYDERAADGSVVGGELHLEALLPPGDSLVGPEYDEGVLVLAGFLEGFDQPADSVVDCEDSLVVLPLKGMEIGAVNEFSAHRATRKPTRLEYGKTIGAGDPLFLVSGILGFSFPRGIDVLGDVNLHSGVVLEVPLGGGKGAVDGPIADPEVKGFLFVLSVSAPNVFLGPLGVVVGRVSLGHDRLGSVRLDQLFLEVVACVSGKGGPVPDLLEVPVAPETIVRAGVPFADLSGLVPVLPEYGRPKRAFFRLVDAARIFPLHPHRIDPVGLVPGEKGGPRTHASGAHVAMGKANALLGQGIYVWGLHPIRGLRVARDGTMGLVVGEDEENIRFLRRALGRQGKHGKEKNEEIEGVSDSHL